MKAFETWKPLCEKYNCSYANLVEAWALSQFENMNLLVGMRKESNVMDTIKSVDLALEESDIEKMEHIVKDIQVEILDK